MSRAYIEELLKTALQQLVHNGTLTLALPEQIMVEPTKDKQHGDFASNIALMLAKPAARKPREVAQFIVDALPVSAQIGEVTIAGPGFINFFLAPVARLSVLIDILKTGAQYGRSQYGAGKKVLVEFASANPNGPMHVGHGRQGVHGSVVADLLTAIGYDVTREYYVNDAGRQMDILASSVWIRYLVIAGETLELPANAYRGQYVLEMAHALFMQKGGHYVVPAVDILLDLPPDAPQGGDKEVFIDALIVRMKQLLGEVRYKALFDFALETQLADIRADLIATRVEFQNWFSERVFTGSDAVDNALQMLTDKGFTYTQEGALWFRATALGDEKDRVLCRSNGVRTYFANDLAYHIHKFQRGFDFAIDIFGADHHGYLARMLAGLNAAGIAADRITFLLVQFVTLYRGTEQVQMSTRSGSFVTLRELREEVGTDATRFFYLMRKANQHVEFDLELAKSHSNDNPVYYIQYAYARICSVFRQLVEKGWQWQAPTLATDCLGLTEAHEEKVVGTLALYPDTIMHAALQHEPQILTNYLRELAMDFHTYYNACVFLVDDMALRNARLALIAAVRQVLANGLGVLSVTTPESM